MTQVLPYRSAPPSQPPGSAEFDYHFEQELSRRLRRRFLWYCAITVLASLGIMLLGHLNRPATPPRDVPEAAHTLSVATTYASIAIYALAFLIALLSPLRRPTMLRLAMWVYVLATIPGLIGLRVVFQMSVPPDAADLTIREAERSRRATTTPATAPAADGAPESGFVAGLRAGSSSPLVRVEVASDPPTTAPAAAQRAPSPRLRAFLGTILTPAFLFGMLVPLIVLYHHTFTCLFIPWTLRQSLLPAGVLLCVIAAILGLDVVAGPLPALAGLIMLPLVGLMFVPGSAWCWWRFSRMRANSRLRFESERFRLLQTELAGARRILESALPRPRDAGAVRVHYVYEPMRQIGGDLLFVHPQAARPAPASQPPADDGPVSVVLLDVTGHGIAAALSVNRLIGELERLFAASPAAAPADVLDALNQYVYLTMARYDTYVTAVALRVDPHAGRCTYASAGHPTAFLRRADGRICELESTTMLLGIVPGEAFTSDPIDLDLAPGDVLIAYTDGASEARSDETLQMLGMDGVRGLIEHVAGERHPAEHWPAEIMRRVAHFRGAPPADDTLLVAVYRHEP